MVAIVVVQHVTDNKLYILRGVIKSNLFFSDIRELDLVLADGWQFT